MSQLSWQWQPRTTALIPQAVIGFNAVALKLFEQVKTMTLEQQKKLQVTACHNLLILLGEVTFLPWVDGVSYAAPSPEEPGLWLPTHLEPTLPIDLMARAVGKSSVLLWHEPQVIIPLHNQLPLSENVLGVIQSQWQKEEQYV